MCSIAGCTFASPTAKNHQPALSACRLKIAAAGRSIDRPNENHDFVESEMIAFLACRSILSFPITFPKTTGVKKPLTGGTICRPL